jgi:hypothetical protein
MPNKQWYRLSTLQIGRYAEYYTKMEFASYGLDVYTSEVDDHGVDFVFKSKQGKFYEVQVKAIRNQSTIFILKDKMDISLNMLVCVLIFSADNLPDVYLIPAKDWATPNSLLVSRDYNKEGQKSKPEWGINISTKNLKLLEQYRIEKTVESLT